MSETILDRPQILNAIQRELEHAYTKHGEERWSRHEFYGVIKEELDEVWDDIKKDRSMKDLVPEIIQVAAMCIRYLETGDRYRGVITTDTLKKEKK